MPLVLSIKSSVETPDVAVFLAQPVWDILLTERNGSAFYSGDCSNFYTFFFEGVSKICWKLFEL